MPLIVEKIEEGDFHLSQAMWEITGVNVYALYPEVETFGDRSISLLWVRWWKEKHGLRYDEDPSPTEPGQPSP